MINKQVLFITLSFMALHVATVVQAQQYVSKPSPINKGGIIYKIAVSHIEMQSQAVDTSATCEVDVFYAEETCHDGCRPTGKWLFRHTDHRPFGYPGSDCDHGDGYVYYIYNGNIKYVVKNTIPGTHKINHFVGASPVSPKGLAKACADDQSQVARSILSDGEAGQKLGELLKIKSVDVALTDNTAKLSKDESLKYGPEFLPNGRLLLKSVLNSAGECKKIEKSMLLDELAQRASSEYPKLVQSIMASALTNKSNNGRNPSTVEKQDMKPVMDYIFIGSAGVQTDTAGSAQLK
ncbi:hypothetical protein WDW37_19740 [Bdellovibrionota bacterium FG-1]